MDIKLTAKSARRTSYRLVGSMSGVGLYLKSGIVVLLSRKIKDLRRSHQNLSVRETAPCRGVCLSVVSCLVVLAEDDGVDRLDLIGGFDIPTPVVVNNVAAFAELT